jgi:glycosyltransferase involved in cell wall biosynthesis
MSAITPYKASVIICTYNRLGLLRICIESITKLITPASDFEILIINNNSSDGTAEYCTGLKHIYPYHNWRHIVEASQGIAYARSRGAAEATGEIVAYIDDDCMAEPDWLHKILEFYRNNPGAMSTGGRIIPKYLVPVAEWFGRYFWGLVGNYDLGKSVFRMKGARYPAGANMHFRKTVFEKYGYFDGHLGRSGKSLIAGEEKAMYLKLLKAGEQVYYLPQVIVHHHVEENKFDKEYVKRHSMGIGGSERFMKRDSVFKLVAKFLEYVGKLVYAVAYGFIYLLQGKPSKMSMLVKFRWWVIEGFLNPEKAKG